jgi:hypothetical protein
LTEAGSQTSEPELRCVRILISESWFLASVT